MWKPAIVFALCAGAVSAASDYYVSRESLSLAAIKKMVAAAEAEAAKRNVQVTICVMDATGNLQFLERQDGANYVTLEFAQRKARHAALYGGASKGAQDSVKNGFTAGLALPSYFPNQGGLPIKHNGQTIGGISASGAASEVDEAIAQAGLDALTKE